MDSKELWWEGCNGTSRRKQRSVIAVSFVQADNLITEAFSSTHRNRGFDGFHLS